jgi:hypothetical protein
MQQKTPEKNNYISDIHTQTEVAIAVMKTDIEYIKKAVDSMGDDVRYMKKSFVRADDAATKDELQAVKDKIDFIMKIIWVVGTSAIVALTSSVYKLILQ